MEMSLELHCEKWLGGHKSKLTGLGGRGRRQRQREREGAGERGEMT
jgi:hypothetical protein